MSTEPHTKQPIQPGAWLKCIDAYNTDNALIVGSQYLVTAMHDATNVVLLGVDSLPFWHVSRFVVGECTAASSTPGSGEARSESDCRRCGEVPCVCDNPQRPAAPFCSTPACSVRGVVATCDNLCTYCAHRLGDVGWDPGPFHASAENVAARARLAAWSKPVRPLASPKALGELAKPHPWVCDE